MFSNLIHINNVTTMHVSRCAKSVRNSCSQRSVKSKRSPDLRRVKQNRRLLKMLSGAVSICGASQELMFQLVDLW